MTTKVPGPRPVPVLGTAYSINPERLLESAVKLSKQYGEIYLQSIPGKAPLYIISSHRIVEELFDETRFHKVIHQAISNVEPFAGDGLFTAPANSKAWEKGHRILMPAFSPIALEGMYEGMADIAEQLIMKWTRTRHDVPIDVTDDFTRLTLDTIALCSFSYRFNSFYSEGMHPFVDAMVGGLYESGRRAHALELQKKMMVASQKKFDRYIATMKDTVDELIAERRQNPHTPEQTDILDIMLSAKDPVTGEKLDEENVRYQLVNFLIAGHETTSGMLSFTLYLLLRHPEILNKARALVDDVLGGRFPEYEDLPQLAYLDQIFRESLRLYPTAPGIAVTPYATTTIGGEDGLEVHPGDTLFVLIPELHRDPEVWEDPERFDPDRFSFERAQHIPTGAWKPFGNGERSCIGRAFSLQESTIVLALMLQHLDFDFVDPDYELAIKETLTIKPEGFKVYVRPRPGHEFRGYNGSGPEQTGIRTGLEGLDGDGASAAASSPVDGPATGHGLDVLVGSDAGTCRSFGERLAITARGLGFDVRVRDLDSAVGDLDPDRPLLICCSSYEGLPPSNAKEFVTWITAGGESQIAERPDVSQLSYALFGSGNKQWAMSYHRVPKLIDAALRDGGAQPLVDRGEADVQSDFQGTFDAWQAELWPALAEHFGFELPQDATVEKLQVETYDDGRVGILRSEQDAPMGVGVVTSNTVLGSALIGDTTITRDRHEVVVELPEGVTYTEGDYLEVLPRNSMRAVDRMLAALRVPGSQRITISGQRPHLPTEAPISLAELFTNYVELAQPATRAQVERLAALAQCPPDRAELQALAQQQAYDESVLNTRVSVLDLLERFPSITIGVQDVVAMLPALTARRYSIASSPQTLPGAARLVFGVEGGPARSGQGDFEGVCSGFLSRTFPGQRVDVAVVPGPENFCAPEDGGAPMILIGAGSGLAPLLGFLEGASRAKAASSAAGTHPTHLLFYGCQGPSHDYLYREQLESWEQEGLVQLFPAFSREADADTPRYVQDAVRAHGQEIAAALDAGGRVLVCGNADRLGVSVRDAIVDVLAAEHGLTPEQARSRFEAMEHDEGTFVADLFA